MLDPLAHFQGGVEILEAGLHGEVGGGGGQRHLVDPALLGIEADVSEVVLAGNDGQFDGADDGLCPEVDSSQADRLVDHGEGPVLGPSLLLHLHRSLQPRCRG